MPRTSLFWYIYRICVFLGHNWWDWRCSCCSAQLPWASSHCVAGQHLLCYNCYFTIITFRVKENTINLIHNDIKCLRTLRVDIWHDRCDRRSCKILATRVNFSENSAKCTTILPQNKATVLDFITIDAWHLCIWVMFLLLLTYCVMFAQSLHKISNN